MQNNLKKISDEYILESKRTALTTELQPRLLCDEGLIQIGNGRHLFVLSFVIGAVDNLDLVIIRCTHKSIIINPDGTFFIDEKYCVFRSF